MMTTIATKDNSMVTATVAETQASVSGSLSNQFRSSQGELGAKSSSDYEVDVLGQLKANLSQLEDLHGRLKHMMGEISYLLKRN